MKRPYAYIAGTGHAVPKRIVTNDDIAAMGLETDDQWIIERTGIRQRHILHIGIECPRHKRVIQSGDSARVQRVKDKPLRCSPR